MDTAPPVFEDVRAAAERLAPHVIRTPVLRHEALDAATGAQVFLKPECLQHTGSFKIRGATNRLLVLSEEQRRRGVVAFSSGNHAQGVARAARRLGISAVIVMPSDAPKVKVDGVLADGAGVILYDRLTESREAIAETIAHDEGRTIVPSFDDPWIIAGQGSAGVEFTGQMQAEGGPLDALVCCAGGGGLIAGTSLAFQALSPGTAIWGAEPAGHDDHRRSLEAGGRVKAEGGPSICDALLTPMPGELTFVINQRTLSGVSAVTDEDVRTAMRFAFRHLKLVVEPGGAAALAAVLHHMPEAWRGKRVGVFLTGGNVDPALYASVLAQ